MVIQNDKNDKLWLVVQLVESYITDDGKEGLVAPQRGSQTRLILE